MINRTPYVGEIFIGLSLFFWFCAPELNQEPSDKKSDSRP